jgi:hypothetical protein
MVKVVYFLKQHVFPHHTNPSIVVGRSDVSKKSGKELRDLATKIFYDVSKICVQGSNHADHFGFICREQNVECYIAYVFKCQSESVADDVVAGEMNDIFGSSEIRVESICEM